MGVQKSSLLGLVSELQLFVYVAEEGICE